MKIKATRRRFSASEKANILEACERSGLTRKAFALQQGIAVSSLYQWQRLSRGQTPKARPKWIEVPNLMSQAPAVTAYRLHLPGGRMLEVSRKFDSSEVRVLAQLLQNL